MVSEKNKAEGGRKEEGIMLAKPLLRTSKDGVSWPSFPIPQYAGSSIPCKESVYGGGTLGRGPYRCLEVQPDVERLEPGPAESKRRLAPLQSARALRPSAGVATTSAHPQAALDANVDVPGSTGTD